MGTSGSFGGSGGKDAAPIFSKIVQSYHERIEPVFNSHVSNTPVGDKAAKRGRSVQ